MRGWSAWREQSEARAAQRRVLAGAAQRINRPRVVATFLAWRTDWSATLHANEVVRQQAEREGLDRIFTEAGFEWRHSGCSMCLAVNGDGVPAGKRSASTSNRNFVGRQGPEARTHLVSPATAAATAITGRFADARDFAAMGG